MKRLLPTLAVLLLLATPAAGQDFEKGGEAYKRGDYSAALREWRPLTEQGNTRAQYNLGLMYYEGQAVPQDYAEAVKWYRKAAEQSLARSQAALGFMYYEGQGVPQDYVQAHKWLNLAAAQGLAWGDHAAAEARDLVAKDMTPDQIAEARKLAREWMEEHGQ